MVGRSGRVGRAKELIEQRESSGLRVHIVLVMVALIDLPEHTAHLVRQVIQILFREAHLLHRLVDLGNAQTPGALEAIAFI